MLLVCVALGVVAAGAVYKNVNLSKGFIYDLFCGNNAFLVRNVTFRR